MEDWRGGGGRGNIACICTIEMADWGDVNIPTVTWNGDGGCGSTFPPPHNRLHSNRKEKGGRACSERWIDDLGRRRSGSAPHPPGPLLPVPLLTHTLFNFPPILPARHQQFVKCPS